MDTNIQHFKTLLESEKETLERELGSVATKINTTSDGYEPKQTEVGEDTADREDVAEAIENFEENTVTTNALETQLMEVDAALSKIESGTYGKCEVCGEAIENERLEANPSAKTCMKDLV